MWSRDWRAALDEEKTYRRNVTIDDRNFWCQPIRFSISALSNFQNYKKWMIFFTIFLGSTNIIYLCILYANMRIPIWIKYRHFVLLLHIRWQSRCVYMEDTSPNFFYGPRHASMFISILCWNNYSTSDKSVNVLRMELCKYRNSEPSFVSGGRWTDEQTTLTLMVNLVGNGILLRPFFRSHLLSVKHQG